MTYSTALAATVTIALHLADALEPKACPVCLDRFTYRLDHDWIEHLPRLRSECHALFDACIAILTLRRTPDEISRLRLTLVRNRRQCSSHRTFRTQNLLQPLHVLFKATSHILQLAVKHGDRSVYHRAAKGGKSFADKKGRWPSRVEQLFPDGAQDAVAGLLSSCEAWASEGPLEVLAVMIRIARPATVPVLAAEPSRTKLVHVILKMLDPVAAGLDTSAPWLLYEKQAMKSAAGVLEALMSGPGALPSEGTNLFSGSKPALLRAIGSATKNMDDDDRYIPVLADWCSDAASSSNIPLPPRVERWLDARGEAEERDPIGERFYGLLRGCVASRVCAGPGCTLSILDNAGGRPFAACARCRVPRYCSRACQRADWKGDGDAPVAHRSICRVFTALNAHACAEMTLEQFSDVFARAEPGFDDSEVAAINAFLSSFCKCTTRVAYCYCGNGCGARHQVFPVE
ncbi:hypothetical protein AURDEDRAFT_153809 [Auricularia subglabra TFB-10046 SS5]|nr:hypothetical protein AURDEDRAFT_153809 [Auricularia subglabra TFB-10046 SS5]